MRAPAACNALLMNQAKLPLSPAPGTRSTWPLKSREIRSGLLSGRIKKGVPGRDCDPGWGYDLAHRGKAGKMKWGVGHRRRFLTARMQTAARAGPARAAFRFPLLSVTDAAGPGRPPVASPCRPAGPAPARGPPAPAGHP